MNEGVVDRALRRFARRTSSSRFIPQIDGLRFVSIALVVMYHFGAFTAVRAPTALTAVAKRSVLTGVASVGHYGVQLFFAISGFVLALPFAVHALECGPAVSIRKYFIRRLTRLEPPYLLSLVIFALALVVQGKFTPLQALPHFVSGLFYLHNIVYADSNPFNTVAWTLEIEVQFYCIMPALALIFRVRNALMRRLVVLCSIGALLMLQPHGIAGSPVLKLTLLNFAQFFMVGLLLADLYVTRWQAIDTKAPWWDLASLVGWPLLMWEWVEGPNPIGFLVLIFLVFAAALRGTYSSSLLGNRWLITIGGMCYSIYLLHYPLISVLGSLTGKLGSGGSYGHYAAVQALVIIPPLLFICAVYFICIERPCMNPEWITGVRRRLYPQSQMADLTRASD